MPGSEGDSNVFSRTDLGKLIKTDDPNLRLPPNALVNQERLPYFFIADDAFPLIKRILKPYKPNRGQTLPKEEIIFNYRLSRAWRCVENAFGILVSKWACIGKRFHSKPENVQIIVAACCLLHNFMMNQQPNTYIPPQYRDRRGPRGEFVAGTWRNNSQSNLVSMNHCTYPPSKEGERIRNLLKDFVNTAGSLPFQERANRSEVWYVQCSTN